MPRPRRGNSVETGARLRYFKHVLTLLQSVCKECSRALLHPSERARYLKSMRNPLADAVKKQGIHRRIVDRCKAAQKCPYVRRADHPKTSRGDAADATRIFRGDTSRGDAEAPSWIDRGRARGKRHWDVWARLSTPPRTRRGYSAETRAAATPRL